MRCYLALLSLLACLVGAPSAAAQATAAHPSTAQLLALAAKAASADCSRDAFCQLYAAGDVWTPGEDGQTFLWLTDDYVALLGVWWAANGQGIALLDLECWSPEGLCRNLPVQRGLYVRRYIGGRTVGEQLSRIGVPERGQAWSEIKPTLPTPALRAAVSEEVFEIRKELDAWGELPLDVGLLGGKAGLRVTVGTSIVPLFTIYHLQWDRGRGVFVPVKRK